MDLSCIISSGDLELYVLGMLPEEEAKQVEQLIVLFPEVKEEVDRISATLGALANQSAISPSGSVREELFEKFAALKTEASRHAIATPTTKEANQTKGGKVISLASPRRALNVAAIILFVIAASFLIYLAGANRKKEQTIAALERSLHDRNRAFAQQEQQANAYANLVTLMQDDNFKQVKLENLPGKPKAVVDIFWHRSTHELMVVDLSLPSTPPGKQYQLWAIVNGQPVNAGMLQEKKLVPQKMHTFEKAEAFAITLEKAGGSTTPTLQEMYVIGKTS